MSFVYIYESGAKVGVQDNCIIIENVRESLKRTLSIEGVEGVIIFGNASLSSACVRQFMERNINLTWLSSQGKFFGRLESTRNVNIQRQRKQFSWGENEEFCLRLATNILTAKVKNQITILRRYQRNRPDAAVQEHIEAMSRILPNMQRVKTKEELMGHEGIAAREYFKGLSKLVEPEFFFAGRNKQPPKDRFNSLLSFAYTLVLYDLYTAIVNRGMNPYASFIHSVRQGHPALCSDLIEEWRAVLADSLALNVTSRGIIKAGDFQKPDHEKGVYLKHEIAKKYIGEYEKKVRRQGQYLSYADYSVSFRRALEMQCQRLARAIEEGDPEMYQPVVVR